MLQIICEIFEIIFQSIHIKINYLKPYPKAMDQAFRLHLGPWPHFWL